MKKSLFFYLGLVGVFMALMYLVVQQGQLLEADTLPENATQAANANKTAFEYFLSSMAEALHHPLAILLLQIILILIAARLLGYLFSKIGQPSVIGEIIAGILLGPSVLGWLLPEVSSFVFPLESLGNLQFLSQIGLILFMFVIGMELDIKVVRNKAHDAIIISHASIIFPYFLGMALAYYLYTDFAPDTTSFLPFALFLCIGMSITAFPVLARVIQERGVSGTRLGTIAITCAAADDITAWCLLAAVIAIAKAGTFVSAIFTILLAAVYVLMMIKVVQPFLHRLGRIYSTKETITKSVVALVFIVLMGSAYLSEVIGIHALFGAFLAGAIMPSNLNFRKVLTEKIEDVALVLLLPLFFVFTGLRTEIGLLNEWSLWGICLLVILVAVAGKFGGSALAARFVGQSWRESLSIGALMNTRGLMELVVLNIGYDLGILSPEIFVMMVIMALVTTFMTGPALNLIEKWLPEKEDPTQQLSTVKEAVQPFQVLLSFGPAQKGKTLLWLASQVTGSQQKEVEITALHLTPNTEIDFRTAREYERESFKPLRLKAEQLGIKVKTLYRVSDHVAEEIIEIANEKPYDLLLVGGSQSLFSDDQLGGKVKNYLEDVIGDVGVLIDRNFQLADRILIVLGSEADLYLLKVGHNFIKNNQAVLSVTDPRNLISESPQYQELLHDIDRQFPDSLVYLEAIPLTEPLHLNYNLLLITHNLWIDNELINSQILQHAPSVLVLKQSRNVDKGFWSAASLALPGHHGL